MAGIGFELRKLLRRGSYLNIARAYGYAGIISAGPWVISICGIIALDFLKYFDITQASIIQQFQVSITYLIALSLIFSGFTQHSFTRYVADRLFEKKFDYVVPNFNGVLLVLTAVSGLFGFILANVFFLQQDFYFRLFMSGSFVVLCNIWFTTNLLSGLKNYRSILLAFFVGYSISVYLGYLLRFHGLDGLLGGFFVGQFVLLAGMLIILYYYYPSNRIIDFDFLRPGRVFFTLVFTSLFYNLGIWVDKFIFWYSPLTSHSVLGPLHISVIYDLPIFLAYLAIIPGMAIFLFRVETNFVEYYNYYYDSVRNGDTLFNIIGARYQMADAARQGIFDIIRIQGITIFTIFILGPKLLSFLHVSKHYIYLLNIDIVGTSLLVIFLALLNYMFYLDRRVSALVLNVLFFVFNAILTLWTIHLGVFYFGYGFVLALLLVNVIAVLILNHDFDNLEYITFMRK
ncbi:MAG: exopolysaccharide Pel transporter PelG [Gammaproteobacteria bacterium]|jgi:uncharacterized membrane protein